MTSSLTWTARKFQVAEIRTREILAEQDPWHRAANLEGLKLQKSPWIWVTEDQSERESCCWVARSDFDYLSAVAVALPLKAALPESREIRSSSFKTEGGGETKISPSLAFLSFSPRRKQERSDRLTQMGRNRFFADFKFFPTLVFELLSGTVKNRFDDLSADADAEADAISKS